MCVLFCVVIGLSEFLRCVKRKTKKRTSATVKVQQRDEYNNFFYFHETLHNWILMDFGPAGGPPFRFTMAHASTIILYRAKRLFVCSFFLRFRKVCVLHHICRREDLQTVCV